MKVIKSRKKIVYSIFFVIFISLFSYIGLSAIKYGQIVIGILSFFVIILMIVTSAAIIEIRKNKKEEKTKETIKMSAFEKGCRLFLSFTFIAFVALLLFSYMDINYSKTKEDFIKACDYSISQESDKNGINDMNFYKSIQFIFPRDAKIIMTYTINELANLNRSANILTSKELPVAQIKTEIIKVYKIMEDTPRPEKEENLLFVEIYCIEIIMILQLILGFTIMTLNFKSRITQTKNIGN